MARSHRAIKLGGAGAEREVSADVASPAAFSSTKREILLFLKRHGVASLRELGDHLSISKMAVYKHVNELEKRGLVERMITRHGVGRPSITLKLAPTATSIFPQAYSSMTCAALEFIEEKLGRDAVETALRRRQNKVLADYRKRLAGETFDGKVRALAKIRDQDGYMAEVKRTRSGNFELLEHNCPILVVANKYWEACTVETELFQRLLNARVETTHRAAVGDHVCRFLIRPR